MADDAPQTEKTNPESTGDEPKALVPFDQALHILENAANTVIAAREYWNNVSALFTSPQTSTTPEQMDRLKAAVSALDGQADSLTEQVQAKLYAATGEADPEPESDTMTGGETETHED